ncbi:hypothetical protein [Photobacterium sp. Hal280]|uniref:hypothetical protein n=1 Tax=Photobacterium sp. Hal280 TaxID=3035163 RepID=UPI00301CCA64
MTKEKGDMERIDSMFNKSVWLIGIIWTITLGGGAFAFSTSFSYLDNLITNSESKIEKITKNATEKIDAAVLDTSQKITEDLAKKIDVVQIAEDLKTQRIPAIEAELTKTIENFKLSINNDLKIVKDDVNQTRTDVQIYKQLLSDLIEVKEVSEALEVNVYGLDIEPNLPRVGNPAQILARINAPKLSKNQSLKTLITVDFLGYEYKKDLILTSGEFADLSFPIVVNKTIKDSAVEVGRGKYAVSLKVTDMSGTVILVKDSGLFELYD